MIPLARRIAAPALAIALLGGAAAAQDAGPAAADHDAVAARALEAHVAPRVARLASAARALQGEVEGADGCDPSAIAPGYHALFDAWVGVQHIAFGPIETGDRRFAIQFWPDTRGATPKALRRLAAAGAPTIEDADAFAEVSVAARGLTALERLLFDDALAIEPGPRCALIRAVAIDLTRTTAAIDAEWAGAFHALWTAPGPDNPLYRSAEDRTRDLFRSLDGAALALKDLRLGRPLGSFAKPRPRRAEAWRSARSLRNIALAIAALDDLYETTFARELDADAQADLRRAFDAAAETAASAPRPLGEAVSTPAQRIKIEAIQTAVAQLRRLFSTRLAPRLGVAGGFNSLDGD